MSASAARAAGRRDQCRFLLGQVQLLRGRRTHPRRAGRRDRSSSFGERRPGRTARRSQPPDLGAKPPAVPSDVLPAIIPLGEGKARRAAARRARPPCGPWRNALFRTGPRHGRIAGRARGAGALAPLHEPYNLAPIKMAMRLDPELPQVACFDTAFHRTAPEVDQAFALPYSFYEEGVRRYGFHGLSYEYIASVLPERAPEIADGRVVVAHLGNGCSACAMRNRRSVATTMGFTALDGLPMGTRCGELDAGVVLYLIQQQGMSPGRDRRTPLQALRHARAFRDFVRFSRAPGQHNPRARFAVELFCNRVARHIASLASALGGLDGIVFTAGVGENAAPVRGAICRACAWLGLSSTKRPTAKARSASARRAAALPPMC